jgi:hypothetical protein
VTDIFFSYKSDDRERVRPIRDAFAALGFEVFWDQQVPAAVDWDTWIRRHLTQSKCAVVFWSAASVSSDNVRHEATVAKQQNKLIPVLLEPLTVEQFPIGLYAQQAVNLADWKGDFESAEWGKLRREAEAKLTPPWIRQRIEELEAELVAERARREGVERRDKVLQAQIAKEAQARQDLGRERDEAVQEARALGTNVQQLSRALSESNEKTRELSQCAREAENQLQVLTQQRGAPVIRAVEGAHKDVEGRSARHNLPTQWRQKTATMAFAVILAALMIVSFLGFYYGTGFFQITLGTKAVGRFDGSYYSASIADCEERCRKSATCNAFSYEKRLGSCYLYQSADLQPDTCCDSGKRR